jgi:tripartite-type tricarboxylate transporter receptor subunit TctC
MKTLIKTSVAAVALMLGTNSVLAEDFPKRPINLVAPFNAGGGTDLLLRISLKLWAETPTCRIWRGVLAQ